MQETQYQQEAVGAVEVEVVVGAAVVVVVAAAGIAAVEDRVVVVVVLIGITERFEGENLLDPVVAAVDSRELVVSELVEIAD